MNRYACDSMQGLECIKEMVLHDGNTPGNLPLEGVLEPMTGSLGNHCIQHHRVTCMTTVAALAAVTLGRLLPASGTVRLHFAKSDHQSDKTVLSAAAGELC
jgi:hypothetical protein